MANDGRRAGIVGGGIGGLAAAIALRSVGWDVTVFERAPEFTEVGAGLALGPSALAALDALGVGKPVRANASPDRPAGVRNRTGRTLGTGRLSDLTGGDDFVLLHRADLIAILADALPDSCLRPGTEIVEVAATGEIESATQTQRFDLVVAADGVHSSTRRQLWPDAKPVRTTNIVAWRWIVDETPPEFVGLVWGHDAEVGMLPLAGNRTYVYAGTRPDVDGLDCFGSWPDPVPHLVARADSTAVLRDRLLELPVPKTFARGRVVLLGDAAHAMRPTLGQGVGMALEDAVVLASTAPDLAAYTRARRRRVRRISRISRNGSRLAEPGSRLVAGVRDRVAVAVPDRMKIAVARASMRRSVNDWRPPAAFFEATHRAKVVRSIP